MGWEHEQRKAKHEKKVEDWLGRIWWQLFLISCLLIYAVLYKG